MALVLSILVPLGFGSWAVAATPCERWLAHFSDQTLVAGWEPSGDWPADVSPPIYSPDGQWLLRHAESAFGTGLFLRHDSGVVLSIADTAGLGVPPPSSTRLRPVVSANGRVALASGSNTIHVYQPQKSQRELQLVASFACPANCLWEEHALSQDGTRLVVLDAELRVHIFNVDSLQKQWQSEPPLDVRPFSTATIALRAGRVLRLVKTGKTTVVDTWSLENPALLHSHTLRALKGVEDPFWEIRDLGSVGAVVLSSDLGNDGTVIQVWEPHGDSATTRVSDLSRTSVQLSNDEQWLLVAGEHHSQPHGSASTRIQLQAHVYDLTRRQDLIHHLGHFVTEAFLSDTNPLLDPDGSRVGMVAAPGIEDGWVLVLPTARLSDDIVIRSARTFVLRVGEPPRVLGQSSPLTPGMREFALSPTGLNFCLWNCREDHVEVREYSLASEAAQH